ncbi:MAG: DUF2953 domain-containing protein [Clostridia bacterium]|nr:DUF2953 domain-containing protein [Clostridia bacterium]
MAGTVVFIVIAAFVVCLLFSFLRVGVKYDGGLSVIVSILFIRLDVMKIVNSVRERSKKKPKKPKKKKKPEEEVLTLLDKASVGLHVAKEALSGITKTIIFENIDLDMTLGTNDAKNTAMYTGYIYSAAYLIEPFLVSNFIVEKRRLSVRPDFDGSKFVIKADVSIKARLISLIIFGVSIFLAYRRINKAKKEERKIKTAGKKSKLETAA